MSSPLHKKARQLAHDGKQPADSWLAKRIEALKNHGPSVEVALGVLQDMGALILDKRISTDLLIEEKSDLHNDWPPDEIGHISCSVIPVIGRSRLPTPHGLGFSWTPNVAMQLNFMFKDRYVRQEDDRGHTRLVPTGDVRLLMRAKSWGRLLPDETAAINGLHNVWAEYGDQGHSRQGTGITAVREPGEMITQLEAETILAPLSEHVTSYFELTGQRHLIAHQGRGNFTSATAGL